MESRVRTDHIIDLNMRTVDYADYLAQVILQYESEVARLRKMESAARGIADPSPRAADPIFEGGNNLPLGMTQTVGTLPLNPRQDKTARKSADELEAELTRVIQGEKVPA